MGNKPPGGGPRPITTNHPPHPPHAPRPTTTNHPPHPPHPPPPQHTATPARRRKSLLATIAVALLALIVLVGLIILITWLIIRPKKLQFTLDEASINHYNLNNTHLNSTFNFLIRSYNPNRRVSVYYDSLDVYVSYKGNDLAEQKVDPFFQGKKNVTRLRVAATAYNVELSDPDDVRKFKRERTGGSVDLRVKIKGKIRFKVGKWKSRHYKLKVKCSPAVVYSDARRFQPEKCDVDI